MPRSKPNTPVQCEICEKFISRSADMPRHVKTHAENKEALKYPCTHPGCDYRALQRSNLQTHKRTHTGERSKKCPEPGCGFACTDPARLTRHRKGRHGYEPKERRNPAGKNARRAAAAPYPSSRLVAPEASFPVMGSHLPGPATQGFPNPRESSPTNPGSDSSPISQRGAPDYVVSPPSSPYPLRITSSRRSSSPVSPLSSRGSTRSQMRTIRNPVTTLSISPSPEPM